MSTENVYSLIKPSEIAEKVKGHDLIAIDTETTGLDPFKDKLCYLSFCVEPGKAYLVDVQKYSIEVSRMLENKKLAKVFHKSQFDELFLRMAGYTVNGICFDTKIAQYILNTLEDNSLKPMAEKLLGVKETVQFKDLLPKKARRKKGEPPLPDPTVLDIELDKLIPYASADADYTYRLMEPLAQALNDNGLDKIFELDMKVNAIITGMIYDGCKINPAVIAELTHTCFKQMQDAEKKVRKYLGDININSGQQLGEALYINLGLPIMGVTEKGTPSVDKKTLKHLKNRHAVIEPLLQYSELKKLYTTYLDPFPTMLDSSNFLHGTFNQCVTDTGRLSSSNPNLQNIPVKSEIGHKFRNAWVSRFKDGKIVVADYSQIEMRVMAHLSNDTQLISELKANLDLHTVTAMFIYGLPADKITSAMRSVGKTINFGTIYGMGSSKLSIDIDIDEEEAEKYLDEYFTHYPGVKEFKSNQFAIARETGMVETIIGRKLRFKEGAYMGTRAVNYPIQGSAGEIVKLAMVAIDEYLKRNALKTKLILQVHDELVFDCPVDEADKVAANVKTIMENVVKLKVPIPADVHIVDSWGQAK